MFGYVKGYTSISDQHCIITIPPHPSSDVLKSLGIPLITSTLIATATTVYMKLLQSGQLPDYCPDITLDVAGGIGPSAFALSLLLVFRTNSSYGRFQEVRSFFAGTTQRIRDLGRQVCWFWLCCIYVYGE